MEDSTVYNSQLRFVRPSAALLSSHPNLPKRYHENPEELQNSLSNTIPLFRALVDGLKRAETTSDEFKLAYILFVSHDGLYIALSDPDFSAREENINDVVKIPDLVANAFMGKMEESHEQLCLRVLKSITLIRNCPKLEDPQIEWMLLEKFCLCYSMIDIVMKHFVSESLKLASCGKTLAPLLASMSRMKRELLIKTLISHSKSGADLLQLLEAESAEKYSEAFSRLLLGNRHLPTSAHANNINYLNQSLSPDCFASLFMKTLSLWADPVIAKAYVSLEVVHYTKIAYLTFCHFSPESAKKYKAEIVKALMQGLPNHFNSSDGRTINLAKFFSQLITDTINFYEKNTALPSETQYPDDALCQEVLSCFIECKETKHFWYKPLPVEEIKKMNITATENNSYRKESEDSDDDDDDLEPIDDLEPPKENKIKYIRNFLEDLPVMKTHDEVMAAFNVLPSIIKNQLGFEHPKLGHELIDFIFVWENEFEDPKLDETQKMSLCSILVTKPVGNVDHFLNHFNKNQLQSYKKSLVLDVISTVSKQLSLVDLQHLARCAFNQLLLDETSISAQDLIVRIPLIMTLLRLLCLLREQLVEEQMVVKFMKSVSSMSDVDAATEQTICYALNNIMNNIGSYKISSDMQSSICDTRDWLLAIQSRR